MIKMVKVLRCSRPIVRANGGFFSSNSFAGKSYDCVSLNFVNGREEFYEYIPLDKYKERRAMARRIYAKLMR